MSNGDVSPKYGSRAFTDSCMFESRITRIKASCKDNRLVALLFYTEHDGEFLSITGSGSQITNNTVAMEMHGTESLIGFKMRVSKSVLQGLSFTILTSKLILAQL